jgi:hypothetical protein
VPTQLTAEQRYELQQHDNKPVQVVDPVTNAIYFLVAGEMFERFQAFFDDEPFDIRETYANQSAAASRTGWDDPEMAAYDNYDAHKPQS